MFFKEIVDDERRTLANGNSSPWAYGSGELKKMHTGGEIDTYVRTINRRLEVYGNGLNKKLLAHLSHRLMVSYCHQPMSVVRRQSSVVRRPSSTIASNDISSETAKPRAIIFGM